MTESNKCIRLLLLLHVLHMYSILSLLYRLSDLVGSILVWCSRPSLSCTLLLHTTSHLFHEV